MILIYCHIVCRSCGSLGLSFAPWFRMLVKMGFFQKGSYRMSATATNLSLLMPSSHLMSKEIQSYMHECMVRIFLCGSVELCASVSLLLPMNWERPCALNKSEIRPA